MTRIARVLTVASSDSGGGAGIQADLRAFAAAGCHGSSAIVALTAQNTREVRGVHPVPADFIEAQLSAVFDDIGVDAAKTGMLYSAAIIDTVAAFFEDHRVPLVVDPVLIASSGARLLGEDAVAVMVRRLFPLATVISCASGRSPGSPARGVSLQSGCTRWALPRSSSPGATATPSTTCSTGRATSGSRWRGMHPLGDGGRAARPGMAARGRRAPRCGGRVGGGGAWSRGGR